MARRRSSGLAWRVVFGSKGPTKKALKSEMKKGAAKLFGPREYVYNPKSGQLVPKKATGKKTTASRASKPSKPSRAGQVQRRTTPTSAVAQPPRLPESQPMTERALRNPDGTLAGSRKDPRKAALEYQRIMQRVAELERLTDRDLGWDREA